MYLKTPVPTLHAVITTTSRWETMVGVAVHSYETYLCRCLQNIATSHQPYHYTVLGWYLIALRNRRCRLQAEGKRERISSLSEVQTLLRDCILVPNRNCVHVFQIFEHR